MSRRPRYAGAGARTQQTGMVLALALQPATFQRTLMPRSTVDQALTTGICGALDYGFAALIQDTVEAVALRMSGATSPEQADPRTWRRASIAADLAAIALGLAGQTASRPRPGERVPRGAVRTACWWASATGLCGAVAGVLQELAGRGNATDEDSVPVALAAGMLLAGVNEYRRRRFEAAGTASPDSEDAGVSALKALGMSLGVSGGLSVMAAGERVFDRELLMVISPTGSGYVNYVAVEAAEYMTRGNIASVTMQYSLRPSALSLDRVAEGRLQYRMLIDAIRNQLAERPAGQRPRVVIFGESLGAWTSQDAFAHRGTQGLLDAAIDRAIWIGTPYMSKWEQESLGSDRPDVDPSLLGRFNDFGQLQALDRQARERLRYVLVTHDNDGVACFGPDLLARAPGWLGPAGTRPAGVPKTERWQSPATFVQTLIDMKNSASVIPGQFEAKGHDYRADLARFVREVYTLPASDEQLAAIEAALRANELQRAALLKAHHPTAAAPAGTPHSEQRNT